MGFKQKPEERKSIKVQSQKAQQETKGGFKKTYISATHMLTQ
jgi:hypothetical protein